MSDEKLSGSDDEDDDDDVEDDDDEEEEVEEVPRKTDTVENKQQQQQQQPQQQPPPQQQQQQQQQLEVEDANEGGDEDKKEDDETDEDAEEDEEDKKKDGEEINTWAAEEESEGQPSDSELLGKKLRPLRLAVLCSNNVNRSMAAHALLAGQGFNVRSFGTNPVVLLPGPDRDQPHRFDYGVTYEDMRDALHSEDPALYERYGVLLLLDRNRALKPKPELFHLTESHFDLIITCCLPAYNEAVSMLTLEPPVSNQPVMVVNVEEEDNYEDARAGAEVVLELVVRLASAEEPGDELEAAAAELSAEHGRQISFSRLFY